MGKLDLIVNCGPQWHDVGSNLYKSKKMRVGSLWNNLPWFHNNFQVGEVEICFGIVKNSGFSVLHNDSSIMDFLTRKGRAV